VHRTQSTLRGPRRNVAPRSKSAPHAEASSVPESTFGSMSTRFCRARLCRVRSTCCIDVAEKAAEVRIDESSSRTGGCDMHSRIRERAGDQAKNRGFRRRPGAGCVRGGTSGEWWPADWTSHASALPDAILMDIQMPGMDGLAVTRLIKADPATARIKVLAVKALAMHGTNAACERRLRCLPCEALSLSGLVGQFGAAAGPCRFHFLTWVRCRGFGSGGEPPDRRRISGCSAS
jgi:CheY-like chemotaxis protein